MLVGQQIGPFLIEKELGAGAMGAVYRGKYLKTGQVVAVKVMAPGLGTQSGSHSDRFKRESEILKQLNHPNIVRHFGAGKHQGIAYYAMEYVQGETLDRVMARRDRMTWEEVVDLGQQLCAALQHAHEAGIVHRDLKPSNLMILPDGTLKLTDFGIAKDLDVTALTGANCTVGTAAYMSPEQCKGDPNLTNKSDLYSLGIVLYELVTGRKPFITENAMDMFLLHVNGTFERPARIVPEIPVWLDNLICQLMEKKPEQRPRDAARVAQVLDEIREKVETRKSAGVDAVQSRRMDRPRSQRITDDEDKEAARTLANRRPPKKPKSGVSPLMIGLQAGGIILALVAIAGIAVLLMQPPSADKLYTRADKLMASTNPDDWEKAVSGPIKEYLRHYGKRDDETTKKMRAWSDAHEVRAFEVVMDRYVRNKIGKSPMGVPAQTDGEDRAFKAALAEYEGNREEATNLWKEALEKEPNTRVGTSARAHLDYLAHLDVTHKYFETRMTEIRDKRTEPAATDEYTQQGFRAWRQERIGDRAGAKRAYEKLRESVARDARQRYWALFASIKTREMKESLDKKPQDEKKREEEIKAVVDGVIKGLEEKKGALLDLRATAYEVVWLYEKDEDMAESVKRAKEVMAQIDQKLGK